MVEAGGVTWDVVDVEYDCALQACGQGLLDPLDFAEIDREALDPRFVSDCAVGSFQFFFVLGYNPVSFADAQPATLADGVAPDQLYLLDPDRAFAKLDTIKGDIIWWSGGAQSQQLLASGEAPIGFYWNGRLSAVEAEGLDVGIVWDQNITAADALVVPKGAPNKDAAMRLIAQATSAQAQANFAAATGYAPINTGSAALMDPDLHATLPDRRAGQQINADMVYWGENRDEIALRWHEWQAN
ncbi:extracellular solute-binding protein [Rubellimicrobium aerolatum]|uniref:Extracellular solute-binding protein n=1 Tax=Rubellimicrobium aerolatum TaxID=490979 RepID=A0ABW0SED2_9RHOB|nr:extracellular solute-binding protein [Rubellimicrobium aerolatum]MBP1806848.1 putative spermidine/putrescine transport system substrate-binding protein [Rubellimicrobium aerolatum]